MVKLLGEEGLETYRYIYSKYKSSCYNYFFKDDGLFSNIWNLDIKMNLTYEDMFGKDYPNPNFWKAYQVLGGLMRDIGLELPDWYYDLFKKDLIYIC